MPDPIFADPRLAGLYDAFDGERDDLPHYVALAAELGAARVLDVGCGTGSLAVLLAAAGHEVTGVDPAEASLRVARAKDADGRVAWIHGDAATLPPLDADLAVMTGNVAQVFLTDDDWAAALRGIRAALRPGGHLVFETRRPERRAWREWAADPGPVVRGPVRRHLESVEVRLPLVSFRYSYRFAGGEVVTSDSTLRFRGRREVERSLAARGFTTAEVREAPDRPGREFVFLARRAD